VAHFIPELVSFNPYGYTSVDSLKMSIILIDAIINRQKQIQALNLEIGKHKDKYKANRTKYPGISQKIMCSKEPR